MTQVRARDKRETDRQQRWQWLGRTAAAIGAGAAQVIGGRPAGRLGPPMPPRGAACPMPDLPVWRTGANFAVRFVR
jgi:hypothetical protein